MKRWRCRWNGNVLKTGTAMCVLIFCVPVGIQNCVPVGIQALCQFDSLLLRYFIKLSDMSLPNLCISDALEQSKTGSGVRILHTRSSKLREAKKHFLWVQNWLDRTENDCSVIFCVPGGPTPPGRGKVNKTSRPKNGRRGWHYYRTTIIYKDAQFCIHAVRRRDHSALQWVQEISTLITLRR